MLDIAQVTAWTRMFAGYARHESIVAAAKDTFDPAKPCALCRAVGKAREAGRSAPAAPSPAPGRMDLIFQSLDTFVVSVIRGRWPAAPNECAPARPSETPLHPPKSCVA
jgi:hypothetical protein